MYEENENDEGDSNPEPEYCEEMEVVLDQWPPIKGEAESAECDEAAAENTPPRKVVLEGSNHVQEDDQHSPPRRVVYEETVRTTPVKDRVGQGKDKEDQRTKSAKERLGTRPLDKDGRKHVLDRIQSVPIEGHSDQGQVLRSRNGNPREAHRRSRSERDRTSTRQGRPRGANSKEFLAALCGKEIKTEVNRTDSEDEDRVLQTQWKTESINLPCVNCKRHRNLLHHVGHGAV